MRVINKIKVKCAAVCIMLVVAILLVPIFNMMGTVRAAGEVVYTYKSTDPLYAATHFHIFAQEKAILGVHTHGNVATKVLDGQVDYGTRTSFFPSGKSDEISYARDLLSLNPNTICGMMVLGSDWELTSDDSANRAVIHKKGTKTEFTMNAMTNVNFKFEAEGTDTIDLDAEFVKLRALSREWSEKADSAGITSDFSDQNSRYINIKDIADENKNCYYNLSMDEVDKGTNIDIKGLVKKGTGLVVINIDMGSNADKTINFKPSHIVNTDGEVYGNAERGKDVYGDSRIVYNFYNSNAADKMYTGKITWNPDYILGTVMAPAADTLLKAVNGTVVARNYENAGGESHRWDVATEEGNQVTESTPAPTATPTTGVATATPVVTPTTGVVTPTVAPTATPTVAPTGMPTITPVVLVTPTPGVATATPVVTPTIGVVTATPVVTPTTGVTTATPVVTPTTGVTTATPVVTPMVGEATATPVIKATTTPKPTTTPAKGGITITIREDDTDVVIPGADIVVKDKEGNVVVTGKTDDEGKFTVKNLDPGEYTIKVASVPEGYTLPKKTITVNVKPGEVTKKRMKVNTASSEDSDDTSDTGSSTSVDTGDNFDMRIPIALMCISGIGMIVLVTLHVRRRVK